ncbi:MAG: hypothetical protein SFW09_16615 [Hyphomicrobiaceae bacterium]|nr:hypothetical protein [Hyphomicrobiaceae bacterium]
MTPERTSSPQPSFATDFGREMGASSAAPRLADALRQRSDRIARADAWRYHLWMGGAGFAGGLVLVVPLVLAVTGKGGPETWLSLTRTTPTDTPGALTAGAGALPSLVSAPRLTARTTEQPIIDSVQPVHAARKPVTAVVPAVSARSATAEDDLTIAKAMILEGNVVGARKLLSSPSNVERNEALFMMAETYDPNVLAALGITGVMAETATARRLYEAAAVRGNGAAEQRLQALR